MQSKECADIKKEERVFLAGMEFVVEEITHHGYQDTVHDRYLQYLEFHLNDRLDEDFGDDTGSLSICRDPQSKLDVLGPDEIPPQPFWKGVHD